MNVSMWMTHDPITVRLETPVVDAARLMARKRVRRLLVTEPREGGVHLRGIISARDVIHAFPPDVNPFAIEGPDARATPTIVSDIMRWDLYTTTPDAPIEEAAAIMLEKKVGALPVLRGKNLAGLITESDIFRAFVSLFASPESGARITFDATKGEDVFGLLGKLSQRDQVRVVSLIWTQQESQPVCVVRVAGEGVDALIEDIWASGHLVLNVIRYPPPAPDGKEEK